LLQPVETQQLPVLQALSAFHGTQMARAAAHGMVLAA
jgi:hypothetical protein